MALDWEYAIATGLGALAAIAGGLVAHRYEHLLGRRTAHFQDLRVSVLQPWRNSINTRLANLNGSSPYISLDYSLYEYSFQPGSLVQSPEHPLLLEDDLLVKTSLAHWPEFWEKWNKLNQEFESLGQATVSVLRAMELRFPALPEGKVWVHYEDVPNVALKLAVLQAWTANGRLFERATYPNYVRWELARLGFWRGDSPQDEKFAYADAIIVSAITPMKEQIAHLEALAQSLSARYKLLSDSLQDAQLRGTVEGKCRYCPRMTTAA